MTRDVAALLAVTARFIVDGTWTTCTLYSRNREVSGPQNNYIQVLPVGMTLPVWLRD